MSQNAHDQQLREAISIFADALEAAVTQLRQNLDLETKRAPKVLFDLSKISTRETRGDAGPFHLAEESANSHCDEFFMVRDYLKQRDGYAMYVGSDFVWLMPDKVALGIKHKGSREAAK